MRRGVVHAEKKRRARAGAVGHAVNVVRRALRDQVGQVAHVVDLLVAQAAAARTVPRQVAERVEQAVGQGVGEAVLLGQWLEAREELLPVVGRVVAVQHQQQGRLDCRRT